MLTSRFHHHPSMTPPGARDSSLTDRTRGKRGDIPAGQYSKKRHHNRVGHSVSPYHRPVLPHSRMGTLIPWKLRRVSLRTLWQRRMSGAYPYPAPRGDVERIERPSSPRFETSMRISALQLRVETMHETRTRTTKRSF